MFLKPWISNSISGMIRVPSPYFHSLKIIIIIAGLIFDLKPIAVVQLVIQSRYMRYTEEHQLTVSLCQSCVCVWWRRRKLIRLVDLIQSHRSKEMTSHWFHLDFCTHLWNYFSQIFVCKSTNRGTISVWITTSNESKRHSNTQSRDWALPS